MLLLLLLLTLLLLLLLLLLLHIIALLLQFSLQRMLLTVRSPLRVRVNPDVSVSRHYQGIARRGGRQRFHCMLPHVGVAQLGPEAHVRVRVQACEMQQRRENRLVPSVVAAVGAFGEYAVHIAAAPGGDGEHSARCGTAVDVALGAFKTEFA
jgi:hypothetical protein